MTELQDILGQIPVDQIAGMLGTDRQTAQAAVEAAVPTLLAGMQSNAQASGGRGLAGVRPRPAPGRAGRRRGGRRAGGHRRRRKDREPRLRRPAGPGRQPAGRHRAARRRGRGPGPEAPAPPGADRDVLPRQQGSRRPRPAGDGAAEGWRHGRPGPEESTLAASWAEFLAVPQGGAGGGLGDILGGMFGGGQQRSADEVRQPHRATADSNATEPELQPQAVPQGQPAGDEPAPGELIDVDLPGQQEDVPQEDQSRERRGRLRRPARRTLREEVVPRQRLPGQRTPQTPPQCGTVPRQPAGWGSAGGRPRSHMSSSRGCTEDQDLGGAGCALEFAHDLPLAAEGAEVPSDDRVGAKSRANVSRLPLQTSSFATTRRSDRRTSLVQRKPARIVQANNELRARHHEIAPYPVGAVEDPLILCGDVRGEFTLLGGARLPPARKPADVVVGGEFG